MGITTGIVPQNINNNANNSVGQFISTTTTPLYIASRPIGFTVHGLKPNTKLSLFFDGINISSYCSPAAYDLSLLNPTSDDYHITNLGGWIYSDSTGKAIGLFNVPAGMFQIGTREFHVFDHYIDADDYNERILNHSCRAFGYFNAFNYSGIVSPVPAIIATIPPGSRSSVTLSTRGSGTATAIDANASRNNPLSQTFYIGSDLTDGQDGLYLSAVDLFVRSKHQTQPLTIDIRTVDTGGIPTTTILPYSQVTVEAANVNDDITGQTATTFTFSSPIYLRSGYSYSITVTPGGGVPDYIIYTAIVGDLDDVHGRVDGRWGQGFLYTAVTGSNWTPIHTEFLKFVLYRHNYANYASTGTAKFVNKDYEFISYSNTSNIPFSSGEYVYQMPQPLGAFVTTTSSSNLIGVNTSASYISGYTLSTDFSAGDYVLVLGSTPSPNTANNVLNWGLFSNAFSTKVTAVNGNNTLSLANSIPWTNSAAVIFKPAKGTVSITAGSNTVIGTGTRFDLQYTTAYQDQTNKIPLVAQWGNGSVDAHEVLWPSAIINATAMTLRNAPLTSNATAIPLTTPVGRVVSVDTNRQLLILDTSSSNGSSSNTAWQNVFSSPSYFSTSRVIVGTQSGATALISRVVDISASTMQPIVYNSSVQGTTVSYSANATTSRYADIDYPSISTSATTYLTNNQVIIASKTNEINSYNGNKSFTLNASLTSNSALTSPSIDVSQLSILTGTTVIGPDASNEYTNQGTALAKSISKVVTLGDGNDAEDLQVYLTAYRPAGTDIQVYVKVLNSADTDTFDNKYWSQLSLYSNNNLYSDSSNSEDWKEYQFGLPTDPISFKTADTVTTNNSITIVATNSNTNWQSIYSNNQTIVVYTDNSNNPSSYEVHNIANVVSNTQITLNTPISFSNTSSAVIGSMATPYSAYKNSLNSSIVRYYTPDGAAHDTFIQYAIKIVLLSSNSALPPKVQSMQAIALSV